MVDTLVLREQRQFDPLTRIGAWISLCAMLAAMGLVGAIFLAIDPLPLSARAAGLGLYSGMVVVGIGSAIAGVARWRRERDLEDDDEDDDQEPELEDDRAIAPA